MAWVASVMRAGILSSRPQPASTQAAHGPRDLHAETALVVAVVDPDSGPGQETLAVQPGRQRAGGRVPRRAGGPDAPLVVVAVGVGERRAGSPQPPLDLLARPHQLLAQRRVVERGEARMRAGVRPDLPPRFGQPAELVPGHR